MPKNLPIQAVGIISKSSIAENAKTTQKIINLIKKHKKDILLDQYTSALVKKSKKYIHKQIMQKADLVVTLGGDGTILKAARAAINKETLLLSINLGKKGFLTEVPKKEINKVFDHVFRNKFSVDPRTLLRVTIYRKNKKIKTFLALNEAVINQGSFSRLISLRTEINQRKVTDFVADGLIIATPTGSTAHSLSAGGPIVHPKVDAFILTPVCPHSLGNRSIVIPNDRQIKIVLETFRREGTRSEVGLTLDGQVVFPLKYGDEIKIRKSSRSVNMIRMSAFGYFKTLRTRINWGR